ncbi:MAG: hypothetical protein KME17_04830 [Cyanosarcina radialis HA8281-LM2]|nr:hypothetical protein [Cyanosarcina radialis HA8281-LM2]
MHCRLTSLPDLAYRSILRQLATAERFVMNYFASTDKGDGERGRWGDGERGSRGGRGAEENS